MMVRRIGIRVFAGLAAGGFIGWMAASDGMGVVKARQQEEKPSSAGGTPKVLPVPDFEFKGKVGKTYKDSDPPQFPQPVKAPRGAPNVVLILLDDTGFGQYSARSAAASRRRRSIGWPRTGCGTTGFTPRPCAVRLGLRSSPAAITIPPPRA